MMRNILQEIAKDSRMKRLAGSTWDFEFSPFGAEKGAVFQIVQDGPNGGKYILRLEQPLRKTKELGRQMGLAQAYDLCCGLNINHYIS